MLVCMPVDERTLGQNETWRLRLEALAARLTPAGLMRTVEGDWTVAVVFAHLAFWDTLDVALIERWRAGQEPPIEPDWYADALNAAALPAWRLVLPRDAARLALEAASAIDGAVAALPDDVVAAILARDEAWMVRRYLHRREHITQVENILKRQDGQSK
jgi:hypothetical protein